MTIINFDITQGDNKWKNCYLLFEEICNKLKKEIFNFIYIPKEIKKIVIDVSLLNNKRITKLNKKFRGEDKATNVLSFPSCTIHPNKWDINAIEIIEDTFFAGDIIFAYEKIEQEVKDLNKILENHLTHLIIHSILHLFGYDHIRDEDAKIMEDIEVKLLNKLGIESPYE